ncbi:MAG TPA: hypothetical protein VFU88_17825, partial [Ktedonobacterales bacterium]|nr:hypothetical protein [Ktedonobacterales bacterium]
GAAPIWNRSMVAAIQRYNLKPHNCNTVLPGDCLLVNPSNNQPPLGVKKLTYTSNGVSSSDWVIVGDTLPKNSGSAGPTTLPCINIPNDGSPWQYSSPPHCAGLHFKK